jgi:hypothetical protein
MRAVVLLLLLSATAVVACTNDYASLRFFPEAAAGASGAAASAAGAAGAP